MSADYEHAEVKNNPDEQRYEVMLDGQTAMLVYERKGNAIVFVHTEVPPALEGHGIANKLAQAGLEDARTQHLSVYAVCPFVAGYIRRHRDYLSLLPEREQKRIMHS